MGTEVRNIIEDMLNACISSARAEPMKLKQGNKYKELHAQLHVGMMMPSGSDKSTILDQIPDKMKIDVLDYTLPAIVGTIKKTGEVVEGFVTEAAWKCLVIDECHSLGILPRKALLKLTEQQKYQRGLGYKVAGYAPIKKKKKLCISAKGTKYNIDYVRFSSLLAGIFQPKKRIDDRALASRLMPITLGLTLQEARDLSLGKQTLNLKPTPYKDTPVFEDYEKWCNLYYDTIEQVGKINPKITAFFRLNPEYARRGVLHFSRLFCWDSRGNSVVDDWEKYIPYIPLILFNAVTNTLTHREFQIYSMNKRDMKTSDIAIMLGCSEANVSKILTKIRGLGLG